MPGGLIVSPNPRTDGPPAEPVALGRPLHDYARIWADTGYVCLLDSAMHDGPRGRWSFLAGPPTKVLRVSRRRPSVGDVLADVEVADLLSGAAGTQSAQSAPAVWEAIRGLLAETVAVRPAESPEVPFVGGAVGYVGYEALHLVETLPDPRPACGGLALPDIYLLFVDSTLAYDHASNAAYLSLRSADPRRNETLRGAWLDRIRSIEEHNEHPPVPRPLTPDPWPRPRASMSEPAYLDAVRDVQARIAAGDLYEMNLTYQLRVPFDGDPWQLYNVLRERNPAPFAAYLELPEATVLCCSPERFLHLAPDGRAETRPIKGTRPRGRTPADDDRLRAELAASEKDRAEHVMIVDLLRNDLGRVCRYGTIDVSELMAVESYASVHQMVSTIHGRLRPECDGIDLLRACFPGGSMTGAPKIAAMKLIQQLEPVERGVYSGCIGYFDARGGLDLNIVIRTAVLADGLAHIGTGGAIVADSDPAAEYEETRHKARPLLDTIVAASAQGCTERCTR